MLNREKHRQIMYNILTEIFSGDLSKYLAFKGGTACYFLHNLDRFSTDLDFDLINSEINIDEKLIEILKKYGEIKKRQNII
ncbi:MAG: nucleotidyl transferase AbiEii/AbiGii toxin family protein [Candidatus Gracilibacteria bacterium]|nr:nucleotidyl transferase AbiEii/AbiGii toxin family protein [Candidatus Gracilibacteria bacterium]